MFGLDNMSVLMGGMEGFCAKTHVRIDWFMQMNPVRGSQWALGGGEGWLCREGGVDVLM